MKLHGIIESVEKKHLRDSVADIRVGETVRVHYRIREGNKERAQIFEGLVIKAKSGKTLQGSFTVRKVTSGIGVERTFPLHSPWIIKIERTKTGKVRRAKLNYVRKYALSSRFKLKDKGVEGTIWEQTIKDKKDIKEVTEEQNRAETVPEKTEVDSPNPPAGGGGEKVEEKPETADNTTDETKESGEESGKSGDHVSKEKGSEDPKKKLTN